MEKSFLKIENLDSQCSTDYHLLEVLSPLWK